MKNFFGWISKKDWVLIESSRCRDGFLFGFKFPHNVQTWQHRKNGQCRITAMGLVLLIIEDLNRF